MEELAALVEAIDGAAKSVDALPALLSTLRSHQNGFFADSVLLKGGSGGGSFVIVHAHQLPTAGRSWMRWPLRRLFARMKPSRITNPCDPEQHALAIPFAYGAERYVVLATLTARARGRDCARFFEILEHVTVPGAEAAESASPDIPATPMEPAIAGFGLCDELYDRINETLQRRGWAIDRVRGFSELWNRMREIPPDVIAIDLDTLDSPMTAILGIHRAADSATLRVVGFGGRRFRQYGAEPAIDRILPHDAEREMIFKTFKQLAREAASLRRTHVKDADLAEKRHAQASLTAAELVQLGASRAAEIMHGWACCVLFSEAGKVYRAEYPQSGPPVFDTIPKSFLSEPFFDLHVGDGFLNEVTDDAAQRMAVLALKPLSGATLPILSDSGERYGVLVACSRHRWADSAAFEALKRLARVLAARHGALKPGRVVIPEFRQELYWERLRDHAVGIDVYRSSDCRIPWRYRALSDTKGLLTLGLSDDGVLHGLLAGRGKIDSADMMRQMISFDHGVPSFAAAIDFTSESISYAAQGFTPPISLAASGPVGALHDAGGVTAGTATLPSPMEAAIFDTELWRWLDGRNKIERLRPLLEKETPSGLASIVRLGSSQP